MVSLNFILQLSFLYFFHLEVWQGNLFSVFSLQHVALRGVIKGNGILCSCASCDGSIVSILLVWFGHLIGWHIELRKINLFYLSLFIRLFQHMYLNNMLIAQKNTQLILFSCQMGKAFMILLRHAPVHLWTCWKLES